jgi:phosphopantothenoylcysteine decarboxylase / phosphopantothenate---cysteine ligase
MQDLSERRNVVLCVTGSIAAYKSAELTRLLVTRGYAVRVIMSEAATEFITPLTMQSLSGSSVVTSFWQRENRPGEYHGIEHISLADWADAVAIVPATADCIAKLAAGFAETPIQATVLATKAPVLIAPAMNVNMLDHPKTAENIAILRSRGITFVDPEEGNLACGWHGNGRLAEPKEIFYAIRRALSTQDFAQKRVLVATGPTWEAIDPLRFISNSSSGKMGLCIAREAFRRGAHVTLVHGPMNQFISEQFERVPVTSAKEMHDTVTHEVFGTARGVDIVIMAAAVSDFTPITVSPVKLKKEELSSLQLKQNIDILSSLGNQRGDGVAPTLVGLAIETGEVPELLEELQNKLAQKHADLMIGNFAEDAFDRNTNRVWLVDKHGKQEEIASTFKSRVANKVLDAILKL